jgi:hypothetical protein
MKKSCDKGFLVLDVLIAGVVLASCIAATMYLFRVGFDSLERANRLNLISEKALHGASMLRTFIAERPTGEEDLGEGVILRWQSRLIGRSQPRKTDKTDVDSLVLPMHELMLYRVDFSLNYRGYERSYQEDVFRYRPLSEPESVKGDNF